MSRAIIFPGGAGGNHLRWLMYLDKSIDGELSMAEKMDFVLNKVYSDSRSFNNWLPYEANWRFDDKFESFIKILHEPKDDKLEYKSVFLTYEDWNIPFEHYSCLTSCFSSKKNYDLYYRFLKDFDRKINTQVTINQNKLVIQSDVFFDEVLDNQYYTQIVDFFGFENHYDEAKVLHKKWYDARMRIKKEFYEFYSSKFWQDFMSKMRGDVQRDKGLLP